MQCSEFCHVYKGIVSHRLSVTLTIAVLNTPWFNGLEFDGELFSWHGQINNNNLKETVKMCIRWHQWSQEGNTSIPLY